jgi:hypothetical protein
MVDKQVSEQQKKSMQAKELAQYLSRTVLVDKPRITKFKIDWADEV